VAEKAIENAFVAVRLFLKLEVKFDRVPPHLVSLMGPTLGYESMLQKECHIYISQSATWYFDD